MDDDLVLDVQVSPREALARLEQAINQRPRRVLGILKVEPEFVGITKPRAFEIWERRRHAVHAYGRIDRRPGGTRITATFVQSRRTWALLAAFFALYALIGVGLVSRDAGPQGPAFSSAVLVIGGLGIALGFYLNTRRQRADLRRFLSGVFADLSDGPRHASVAATEPARRPDALLPPDLRR